MSVLIAWLWQGAAIAVATALLLACLPRLSGATRHALWWLACGGVMCLPIAYALVPRPMPGAVAAATVPVAAAPDLLLPSLWLAWGLFAAAASLRIVASIAAVVWLKAAGRAPDPVLGSRLGRSRASHLLPFVRVSDRINGACALGLGSPVILLSRSLAAHLDDEALAAVVLHEHAHLDRHDDWWQVVQALVEACAGWHPAVWFIGRQIAIEREATCDDRVLGRETDAREYARALLRIAELRHVWVGAERQLAIPGATVFSSALRRRVRRLLDARMDRRPRTALGTRFAASLVMAATVTLAARVPAMVIFEDVGALLPAVERAWLEGVHTATPPALAEPVLQSTVPVRSAHLRVRDSRPGTLPPLSIEPISLADAKALVVETAAPLPSRVVHRVPGVAPRALAVAPLASRIPPRDSATPPGPWTALGRTASNGGVSVGRFFTRAAKGIAGSF